MSGRPQADRLPRLLFSPIAGYATAGPTDGRCRYAHAYAPRDGRTLRDTHKSDTNHDACVGSVAPSLLWHGARELIDAIPHGPGRTPTGPKAVDILEPAGIPATQLPLALRTRPHEGCPCVASRVRFFGCRSSAQHE